jgi:hypothetical protein
MDAIVEAALRKWPNVPHCHGWLALDARGDWYMRDERIQRGGAFPQVKGSRIDHPRLIEFIQRNYAADADGCFFFQNGPQRVYVELEAAPWIWRVRWLGDRAEVASHTGAAVDRIEAAWLDAQGRLFLLTEIGFGLVHTQDVGDAAQAVEAGLWQPVELAFDAMPGRFGYVLSPHARLSPASADGAAAQR